MVWVIRLTVCLGLYDPLLILPLMVATYILFGGVAGGIYFNEFGTLHHGIGGYGRWGLTSEACSAYSLPLQSLPPASPPPRRQLGVKMSRALTPNRVLFPLPQHRVACLDRP